jgi:hypothetical protein
MKKTEKYNPVDIIELASGRYKVGLDMASGRKSINKADSWDLVIKCVNGEIFPYSNKLFGFHCKKKIIRNRLIEDHPEIAVRNWSDNGEAIFLFEQKDFDLIEKYAAPRKIRKLSENHRTILVKAGSEALKAYRNTNSKRQNLVTNQTIPS